jgi:hypothetical protein
MAKKTVKYVRKDEKKHSVTFVPVSSTLPSDDVLGQVYVRRESGLAACPFLTITVEETEE